MDKQSLQIKALISWATGKVIGAVGDSFDSAKKQTFKVEVTNPDTNLLKEVAENTRGLKGRLDNLASGGGTSLVEAMKSMRGNGQTVNILPADVKELKIDYTDMEVKNTVKTEVVNKQPIEVKTKFPESFRVSNLSDIRIPEQKQSVVDVSPVVRAIESLKASVSSIDKQLPTLKSRDVVFPEQKPFPKEMSIKEGVAIVEALNDGLQGVRDDLANVYEAIKEIEIPEGRGGVGGAVVSSSPVISDVGIKALRGLAKTTAITVSTSATLIPSDSLDYRKSVIIFNNSSNVIYIGGADVTTSNGLPVPASSYSPPIDAGSNMKIYAVAGSSSNIRVLEVSSEREGA